MSTRIHNPQRRSPQQGTILLLTLLALLLIAALGAAMLVLASGESGIVGMQRTSTQGFYAVMAGLEEVRGRLAPLHPNAIQSVPGITLPDALLEVLYVTNPAGGEVVAPQDASNPYYDAEYASEFGVPITGATVQTVASIQPAGAPPMPYKWVRITVKTERSAWHDINADGVFNSVTPIFYAGGRQNLTSSGKRVYRVTALAALPNNVTAMAAYDAVSSASSWNYAIASGNAITGLPPGVVEGNIHSNTEVVLRGPLTVIDGNVEAGSEITGGSLTLNGTHQARANSGVSTTVTGGGSPNSVSGPGSVTLESTPSTPTPAPLAPSTIPNPDWTNIAPAITDTISGPANPPGCGPSAVGSLNALGGCTWDVGSGRVVNFKNKNSFGANDQIIGTGTLIFSGSQSIDFNNPIGSAVTPAQINIIARPSTNGVGFDTISFKNNVFINGLIYSHGEVYSKCPGANFVVRGGIITYNDPSQTGVTQNGDFEASTCVTNFSVRLDPGQFDINMPPGFASLFGGGTPGGYKLLAFRRITR